MPKKILVIDDDETSIKFLQTRLEQNKYEVITAHDGVSGLQKVLQENPDLIILDVEMPKMNGYTFMLEFKKLAELSLVPVIVLTAHEEMQPIFVLKGVRGYLVKPVKFEDLLEKLTVLFTSTQDGENPAPIKKTEGNNA